MISYDFDHFYQIISFCSILPFSYLLIKSFISANISFCEQSKTSIIKSLNYSFKFFLFYSDSFEMSRQKKTFSKNFFFFEIEKYSKKIETNV